MIEWIENYSLEVLVVVLVVIISPPLIAIFHMLFKKPKGILWWMLIVAVIPIFGPLAYVFYGKELKSKNAS